MILLSCASAEHPMTSFPPALLPEKFADETLRKHVSEMDLKTSEEGSDQPASKRRRLNQTSSTLPWVVRQMARLVQGDYSGDLSGIAGPKQAIMFVPPIFDQITSLNSS